MTNNKKKKNKRKGGNGVIIMLIGVLFILAAAGIIAYNIWEANNAYEASLSVLPDIEEHLKEKQNEDPDGTTPSELPKLTINGDEYVGQLDIPSIDMTLPVMAEWSYANLKKAPCAYSGTPYTSDFVIAGHNYARHFSPIKNLPLKTIVYFTDMDANTFTYEVVNIEVIDPYSRDLMIEGDDWDMTLFTCTTGGQSRCAVRCRFAEDE